jgi:transcription elongation factor GreA
LRESSGETPAIAIEAIGELRAAPQPSDPSVPPPLWRTFQELPGARDQERSVEIIREAYGDAWLDEVSVNLQHAAPGMVRPLVDALSEADRQADLRKHYAGLLARPLRAPALLVNLTRYFETPDANHDGLPTPIQRAHALINLATHLHRERRGSSSLTRISNRLTETLTGGETPLLRRLLGDIDIPGLRGFQMLMQRGVDDAVDHLITDIALEHDRNFFAGESTKFWESETIWTTRAGLERRAGELRELQDVKIPENADAIGRAASYGDLSENAEWEAAMEEQRNLTTRAMEIEDELRNVDLIENAVLPEEMVCPGTRVHYRETASGEENRIMILGPWDHDDGPLDIVSYRAPLAQGLLGLRPGELATVHLPAGELDLEVLGVELAEVD